MQIELERDTQNSGLYLLLHRLANVDVAGASATNVDGVLDYADAVNGAADSTTPDFSNVTNVATTVNYGHNQVTFWEYVRLVIAPNGATYVNITDAKYTFTWGAAETTAYAGGDASGYDLP